MRRARDRPARRLPPTQADQYNQITTASATLDTVTATTNLAAGSLALLTEVLSSSITAIEDLMIDLISGVRSPWATIPVAFLALATILSLPMLLLLGGMWSLAIALELHALPTGLEA